MKTAISIPDEVFVSADRLAKRLNMSRSELYTRAIREYLEETRHIGVKEKLDQIYAVDESSLDRGALETQAASIPAEEW